MFNFIFRIIYFPSAYIESWLIFWYALRAISKPAYAMGFQDPALPFLILSPEKRSPNTLSFFQRAECYPLRTNKDIAGCVLIELAAFWFRQAEQANHSHEIFIYGSFCQEGANKILKKEWYAEKNIERSVEEAIEQRLSELREDPYEGTLEGESV